MITLLLLALSANPVYVPVPRATTESKFYIRPENTPFIALKKWGSDECIVHVTPPDKGPCYLFVTYADGGEVFDIGPGPGPTPEGQIQVLCNNFAKSNPAVAKTISQNFADVITQINAGAYNKPDLSDSKQAIITELFSKNNPLGQKVFFDSLYPLLQEKETSGVLTDLKAVVSMLTEVRDALRLDTTGR